MILTDLPIEELRQLFREELDSYFAANRQQDQTEPLQQWFNVDELCNYLPDRPKKQTIYGKVSSNEIPHYKDAKKLRFLKSEIDQWLMKGRKKTSIEMKAEIQVATDAFLSKRKGGNHGK